LFWLMTALENYIHFSASSNTQDNLNSEKVANFPIILLPKKEQTAIANFLDRETAKREASSSHLPYCYQRARSECEDER